MIDKFCILNICQYFIYCRHLQAATEAVRAQNHAREAELALLVQAREARETSQEHEMVDH